MRLTFLVAFLDLLLGMLMMVLLMVNPKAEEAIPNPPTPGNVVVTATWPAGDDDIDLWVKGPTDEVGVGYSNKNSSLFDLLRDDLGTEANGDLGINYENAFSKGMPDGEYIVNVHAFGVTTGLPLMVTVEVTIRNPNGVLLPLAVKKVQLKKAGQELTVIRFKVKDGRVDFGSVHSVQLDLRNAKKK